MTESDIPPEERAAFEEFAAKVDGTNISAQTLLATDYLNHFNEIVMLLDMIPDMPDMVEECKLWQPKSVFMVLRVAVTGRKETPPLFDTLAVIGHMKVLERLGLAQQKLR